MHNVANKEEFACCSVACCAPLRSQGGVQTPHKQYLETMAWLHHLDIIVGQMIS